MEKGILRAERWSHIEVSKGEFQEDGSKRIQESVIGPEATAVVIKHGSSLESPGELETNKQTKQYLSPITRESE